MSGKLRLNGATSGYSELQAPDVAGDQTFTLPAVGGELVTKPGGGQVVGYQSGIWGPSDVEADFSQGFWSRIGQTVIISGNLGKGTTSTVSRFIITNIPYGNTGAGGRGVCMSQFISSAPTTAYMDQVGIYFYNCSNGAWTALNTSMMQSVNSHVYFTATYHTDDTTWIPNPASGATIS